MSLSFVGDSRGSLQHFNLSQNRSLRTLETTAESIAVTRNASKVLTAVLSTVTSPALDVVIVYRDSDLGCSSPGSAYPCSCRWGEADVGLPRFKRQFGMFREMHKTRDFRLVLCADVIGHTADHATRRLKSIVKANGGLGYLRHKPSIISERRTLRTRITDYIFIVRVGPVNFPAPPAHCNLHLHTRGLLLA
jgi:hypothetical protein